MQPALGVSDICSGRSLEIILLSAPLIGICYNQISYSTSTSAAKQTTIIRQTKKSFVPYEISKRLTRCNSSSKRRKTLRRSVGARACLLQGPDVRNRTLLSLLPSLNSNLIISQEGSHKTETVFLWCISFDAYYY
jgi:hypothetical protein